MKRYLVVAMVVLIGIFLCRNVAAELVLARKGHTSFTIVQQTQATPAEVKSIGELVGTLREMTGATFPVITNPPAPLPEQIILVGGGADVASLFPEVDFNKLGEEEFVIQTRGSRLLLAGGKPRGTVYAVARFLQDQCGVRWWTPWATNLPHHATLRIGELNLRSQPAFEYREPYWYCAFDAVWKVHNEVNGANAGSQRIPEDLGGGITYKGFAHTFYPLVPPEKYFVNHPEWYSLIKGKRTHDHGQLCLSNPELRDFVAERVKSWLQETPEARIVSLTQNDWTGACECPHCKAIDDAEGGPSGNIITFANYVAEKIEPEFPLVAIDTFAYWYTRKPPRTVRPRPNVIVRLCSIECNFREPLDAPSNAKFFADLEGWSRICHRLYIWDYTTDFSDYLLPHPNWFTLGENLKLFQRFGVRGVFEQGAYQDWGGEMGELRGWVLAQLLWNPQQDDRSLIREFLVGYYGKSAAKPIGRYLDLLYDASKGFNLGCFTSRANAPHRSYVVLAAAERLWQEAERDVRNQPAILARVRVGHLAVRYAILKDWDRLRVDCRSQGGKWPVSESRQTVARQFQETSRGVPTLHWTQVNRLNESGKSVDEFVNPLLRELPTVPTSGSGKLSSQR